MGSKAPEAGRDRLHIRVADVAQITSHYARLGLRVIRLSRDQALVELPCGVAIVLSKARRAMVAA